ncbi:MAG: ERCC4 domain-containing protein [Candidatus Pacearchaeota archaeon]
MIIADKREKNSLIISELKARGINVKEDILSIGDYIIGNIIIERKTISDFIASMINKRLIKQVINLKETEFENKLIILEGFDEEDIYGRGNLNDNAIRGMILSIILEHKIPIIFTKDYIDTANFLEVLYKRLKKKPREISLVSKPKFYTIYEQQEFIIESFPGIGKTLAREILKKFRTIKSFVNANISELMSVKKLGEKKARKIKNILETEYKTKEELKSIPYTNLKI